MTNRSFPYRNGIVARLRAAAFVILGLLALEVGLGGWLLTSLGREHQTMTGRVTPALAVSSALQANLAEIYALSDRVRYADSFEQLTALESEISAIFGGLTDTLMTLHTLDVETMPISRLRQAIDEVESRAHELLRRSRRTMSARKTLHKHGELVSEQGRKVGALLDQHLSISNLALQRSLERAGDHGLASSAVRRDAANASGRHMMINEQLSGLARRVSAVIESTTTLSEWRASWSDGMSAPHHVAAERARFELRNLPMLISRLPSGVVRSELAKHLLALGDVVVGEGGLIERAERLDAEEGLAREGRATLLAAIRQMSGEVDASVALIEELSAALAADVEARVQLTLLVLGAIGVITVLTVLLSGYHIIERQIGMRMARLAERVLEIADGDTERPIGIDGEDEIGEIARTLRVFQMNARELTRSNEALERFAYAAAHDMRTPLRAIENLAEWTLEDAGDTLSEECRENLVMLLARARRLSKLQSDLLEYAKIGDADDSLADVDLAALVAELHDLIDREHRFEISVTGAPPSLRTHATPLRQILLNLLTNAIKHHDRGHGRLEVAVRPERERVHVAVTDDGPGIATEYHEKVFELFAKLQSKDKVEGSGLGLSMVRKLVEDYGEKISVSSDPERSRGTTFAFALPAEPSSEAPALRKAA